jgi:uncharacterized protein YifN (PemK superfamily)
LSTTPPDPVLAHHLKITMNPPLPDPYSNPTMWLKGDIVLTVAFHRLRLLFQRQSSGQRIYDVRVLDDKTFADVQQCIRAGLGL